MALIRILHEREFLKASHRLLSGRLRCESSCGLWLLLKVAGWVRFVQVVAWLKWGFCFEEGVPGIQHGGEIRVRVDAVAGVMGFVWDGSGD